MNKNIVLIGFMGTGKSSVGSRLAQRLKREFVDMDREIERVSNMTVAEIFRKHGEVRFRSEEQLMAKKLSQRSNLVIATGGGVVLSSENVDHLKRNGILVCLDASPEDIFARVSRKKGIRPLLKKGTTEEDIRLMLEEREPYYRCADIRVNTSEKDVDAVVNDLLQQLKNIL
ncbi:MAG TPA: shikimate kinase [Syntrophomonadaceae bacterium]|nr:shikimate kinase [Syntrophomonadaceae bacterium]